MRQRRSDFLSIVVAISAAALPPTGLLAQERGDTTLKANPRFEAGDFHRRFMGDNWRDEWTTPITVPFLNLRTFAGGLRPTETGGGMQTVNLRFSAGNGGEYVFRPVNKGLALPEEYENTVIWDLIADARSGLHPVGPLPADPIMEAAGVLHPVPRLFVMPDDPLLGEFRAQFAGLLGTIEERPDNDKPRAFRGAHAIIDSEELLKRINADPNIRVDARALLAARLVDMLINDNDRHPDQWMWARMTPGANAIWVPIARDRDKSLASVEGLLPRAAAIVKPSILTFDARYAKVRPLISEAMELDRRLLGQLEKPVWDSVAAALVQRITDPVIEAAVSSMPREYGFSFAEVAGKLRARRDGIPALANAYYATLAQVADIHGTDAGEWAVVNRPADGVVDVMLQSGNRLPHFRRRFHAAETSEIRIYLHGGNDAAIVRGDVGQSIGVRIIGGNGTNTLMDSSRVAGRTNPTAFYDAGTVTGVRYDMDSLDTREILESHLPFNRRPWTLAYGEIAPAQTDRGSSMMPFGSIGSGHGLGLVPRIGIARYKYGFRKVPYASMMAADIAYSTGVQGFDIGFAYDKRFEESSLHAPFTAGMSQLEVVEFRGFGNDVPDLEGEFYDVRQRQWSARPALGFSPNSRSDISLGPILRYTGTDDSPNRFIAQQAPYGFDRFAQLGVQLLAHYDTRPDTHLWATERGGDILAFGTDDYPLVWGKLNLTATAYPGMLDAESAYQKLAGVVSTYLTFPFLTRPVLALRGGGEKLFGNFPYFDAAFIGGSRSLRTEHRQRFAGDASLFGTTELRVPIANFPLIIPLDIGVLGFVDVARVYVDGDSPGGWHQGTGAGFWVAFLRPGLGVSFMRTNNPDRPTLVTLGFAF